MSKNIIHTPEGVRDIYNSECQRKLLLEGRINKAINLYGYDPIQTPTFEYFDVFSEERGTVKAKDMYKFFDREGNTLVLRPDITPSIARSVAKYFSAEVHPLRLCYSGNTFINSSEYQGKAKEITQIGAELINDPSVGADAEMIAMTVDCCLKAGLTEFQVEIGNVMFFKALISGAGFDDEQVEELCRLIVDKNSFGLEDFLSKAEISDELKAIFTKLPSMFGPFERLEKIKELTTDATALAAIDRLGQIYTLLQIYGYEKYVSFDLGMLSKYGYYTGIIFNAYTYGSGDALISGGRYDKLLGQFGKDAPSVGMAVYVDRIMSALSRQGLEAKLETDKLLIIASPFKYEAALQAAMVARQCGRSAQVFVTELTPDEAQLEILKKRTHSGEIKIIK